MRFYTKESEANPRCEIYKDYFLMKYKCIRQ
jgi:hypothetical protein